MTLYALDDIDDAIGATRALLWPFDLRRWAKLALVVFFVGGVGGFNPLQFGGTTSTGDVPGTPGIPDTITSISGPELAAIAAVASVLVLAGLAFLLVGSIMEFVFVASLRHETVTIRGYWSTYWKRGVRLFGFRLVLGLLTFGLVGLSTAAAVFPLLSDGTLSIRLVGLALAVGVPTVILSGLVHGFTTVFVVPIMLIEDRGLLSAWRRFWPTMTGQWKQYAAYAVAGFVLQIAGGAVASIAVAVGALVAAIPLGIVGLLGVGLLAVSQIAGWVVIAVAAALFVFALLALVVFSSVPVRTFLRYYALLVLGDTDEAFDAIPERRKALRE